MVGKRRIVPGGCAVVLALVVAAGEAGAQEAVVPTSFGEQGQLVFDASLQGAVQIQKTSGDSEALVSIALEPSLLYMVAPNVALGGLLAYQRQQRDDVSATSLGAGAMAAVNVPLGARTSLFPRASVVVAQTSGVATERTTSAVGVSVPVLIHVVPHLFFGVGPTLARTLTGDPKSTIFTVLFALGGWL